MIFVDNLFFYLGGQSVSCCKASLAALRLYGYFCDIVVMMLLSENKYDDDDDISLDIWRPSAAYFMTTMSCSSVIRRNEHDRIKINEDHF